MIASKTKDTEKSKDEVPHPKDKRIDLDIPGPSAVQKQISTKESKFKTPVIFEVEESSLSTSTSASSPTTSKKEKEKANLALSFASRSCK